MTRPPASARTMTSIRTLASARRMASARTMTSTRAYLRVGFSTYWCVTSLPGPLREEAELAYYEQWRAEISREPDGDLADACAG